MPETRYQDIPNAAKAFVENLDAQKSADIMLAASVIGDLNADALEFLRRGRPDTFVFLREAHPKTLEWLKDLDEEQAQYVKRFFVKSMQWQGVLRMARVGVGTLFAFFVGAVLVWEKVATWLKVR